MGGILSQIIVINSSEYKNPTFYYIGTLDPLGMFGCMLHAKPGSEMQNPSLDTQTADFRFGSDM